MVTILIGQNQDKVKEIIWECLSKIGNVNIDIIKEGNTIKILEKENFKEMVSLREKLIELEEALYQDKKGQLYKALLEIIEKPLIEHILERTDGNQLKAARILGLNRNTIRAKIKKLGINNRIYKQ